MPETIDEIEITPQDEKFWSQEFLDESVAGAMDAVRKLEAEHGRDAEASEPEDEEGC